MELEHVKQVVINEGNVKRILKGDVVLWQKNSAGIRITTSNSKPITNFLAGWYSELTFTAEYLGLEGVHEWSVSGLPDGLSSETIDGELIVSGYVAHTGTYSVTVTATLGGYSDTKEYIFKVEGSEYGIDITTSNENPITDFALNQFGSKTFEAKFNVPADEQDSPIVWSFSNLPDGLSASDATVSGTATSKGSAIVNLVVTKGS